VASRGRNGKDTGDENTGDQCPYCFRREMETVILNWDRLTGLVRCKVCFKKMRIDDYRKLVLAMKIRKGGRIDTDE
tara:strand:- start:6689 stop:6916 length:228 start_codon:yes stop_codon:yes gene_type:complete